MSRPQPLTFAPHASKSVAVFTLPVAQAMPGKRRFACPLFHVELGHHGEGLVFVQSHTPGRLCNVVSTCDHEKAANAMVAAFGGRIECCFAILIRHIQVYSLGRGKAPAIPASDR